MAKNDRINQQILQELSRDGRISNLELADRVGLSPSACLRQVQDLVPVRGYLSQMDARLHFGLGSAAKADQVEIRWPDGRVETLRNVKANQILTVTEEKK